MLVYLGDGHRRFDLRPVPVHARGAWEAVAVIDGACAPVLAEEARPRWAARRLWCFPPHVRHGWASPRGRACRILVWHWSSLPEPVAGWILAEGRAAIDLADADIADLRADWAACRDWLRRPTDLGRLRLERIRLGLALRLATGRTGAPVADAPADADRVAAAIAWYAERIDEAPEVRQAAAAVGCSAAHLRRLFSLQRREPPHRAFARLRLERAAALLRGPSPRLGAIARACGYADATALGRAFRSAYGVAPGEWRRRPLRAPGGEAPPGAGRG